MIRTSFCFRLAMMWLFLVTMANASHGQESGPGRGNSQLICQQITVFGAVRNPGRLKAEPRMRLLGVLARAGGPTGAAGKVVRLVHTCLCSPCTDAEGKAVDVHEYNLVDVLRGFESGNPSVVAGDIVIVLEADPVFVIGNVIGARSVRFSEGMTVTRAIAMAGGPIRSGGLVTVRIHRNTSEGTRQDPIIIRLKAVLNGHAENVLLQPWDTVEVSDEMGHFLVPRLSPPSWDPPLPKWNPPLPPRRETSGSTLVAGSVLAGPYLLHDPD